MKQSTGITSDSLVERLGESTGVIVPKTVINNLVSCLDCCSLSVIEAWKGGEPFITFDFLCHLRTLERQEQDVSLEQRRVLYERAVLSSAAKVPKVPKKRKGK